MVSQLTTSKEALRLFFTDDVYLVHEPENLQIGKSQVVENELEKPVAVMPDVEATTVVNEPETTYQSVAIPAITTAPVTETHAKKHEFKFLGNNKRNILILVNDAENDVSDEKGRELLRKIVKSVNLTASDFALLNYARHENPNFAELKDHFASVIVFAFGVSPQQLGLNNHPENTVVTEGDVMLIFSAELRKLEEDQNGKKVLWGSLKKLGL